MMMEELLDQDSTFSETNSQDADMSVASEIQSMGNDDSLMSSSGKSISKRSTRGKRRTVDQEKNQNASKRGKKYSEFDAFFVSLKVFASFKSFLFSSVFIN